MTLPYMGAVINEAINYNLRLPSMKGLAFSLWLR